MFIQTVHIPLHLLQTAEMRNSFVSNWRTAVQLCLSSCLTKNIQKMADETYRRWRSLFRCLAGISNALLSTVLSSRPVIRAFAAALRVNTQTVETQLSQVARCFCRITCERDFTESQMKCVKPNEMRMMQ